jgi:antitoxin MazE
MKTRIQKWGNSLAVRIPKAYIEEAGLAVNGEVEVNLVDGQLVIIPIAKTTFTLEALLAGIYPDNIHETVDTDGPMGNEAW